MWHVRCKNAEFVQFTPELKELLLYTHNKLRNQQANGETPGFAPAKRMATMVNSIYLLNTHQSMGIFFSIY